MFWVLLGIIFIAIVFIVIWFFQKTGSTSIWLATYDIWYEKTNSPSEALSKTINVFRNRKPFNVITQEDIDILIEIFSNLKYPQVLFRIFLMVDQKKMDINSLRICNEEKIKKTAIELNDIAEKKKIYT